MSRAPSDSEQAERRGIQSIEVGVTVLEALASTDGPASLKSISEHASMSPSKAHRYLSSFVRTGLVRQDEGTGLYDLAHLALRIGLAALSRIDVVKLSEQTLAEITSATGATSMLSVWSDRGPVIVRWQRSSPPLITSLSLGSVLPMLTSSTGRTFLAHMPPKATRGLVADEWRILRQSGRALDENFEASLAEVRAGKLAQADGDVIPGLRALAGPVFDAANEIAAVITLLSSDRELVDEKSSARALLVSACHSLSEKAGATSQPFG